MTHVEATSAIVLAGGRSSRMGRDKALLKIGKDTLLERLVRILDPLTQSTVIMLSQTLILPPDLLWSSEKVIVGRDSQVEQGPLQGIADAAPLLPQSAEKVFVLSCDLPFISVDWLKKLSGIINLDPSLDAVCSKLENHLNPLIAIYRASIIKSAPSLINRGKRSCLALLDGHHYTCLEPEAHERDMISNINTPQEYQLALEKRKSFPA